MSTSVLRRYTPPTCTLEIAATGSALSRWTDRAVLKNLRFQLSFDDPRLPEDKQITVRGDRHQLEALWEAVITYVQQQLNQPQSEAVSTSVSTSGAPEMQVVSSNSPAISLQPKGLLSHSLCLGTLANAQSGSVVPLSTLQLFDLANVLDEYHAEALTLPALSRPSWLQSRGSWVNIAAVMLLAVGATAAMTKFVTDISSPSLQMTASSPDESSQAPKSALRLPAPPGLEPLPSSLALQPPPTPPVGATVPPAAPVVPAPSAPVAIPAPAQVAVVPQTRVPVESQVQEISPNFQASDPSVPTSAEIGRDNAALRSEAIRPENSQAANSTAFDAIPQVAEVREYFQQKWQPPEGLTQTLEYRLVLNEDGSIQRIVPLGQAAATFLDRTNMPLMNEPFVSPPAEGTPQIRLVLERDGRVQTFLESPN